MSYQLTIKEHPTYLHFIVSGENNRTNVEGYLADILQACASRNCFQILIEERLTGPRLGTIDIFEIVNRGCSKSRGIMKRVAYVDCNAAGGLMKFAEDVAVNRAMPVRVFASVTEAATWLEATAL